MALYGVNAQKIVDNEGVKIGKGETNGRVRCLYDEHTFVADVNAISQTIDIGAKLPAGARVLFGKTKVGSTGTTGIYKIGHLASASGDIVAADDAFGSNFDPGAAAVETDLTGAGLGKKFDEAVQVQVTLTEATDSALGEVLKVWLFYVVD